MAGTGSIPDLNNDGFQSGPTRFFFEMGMAITKLAQGHGCESYGNVNKTCARDT